MRTLNHLFEKNKAWAERIRRHNPDFFLELSRQQSPSYLWIGCADSRVPANEIVGLSPGELFVHRNVANLVVHTDLNCLSVMQFAVDLLKVRHIIVCGHYGCSGVLAALRRDRLGLSDNWLRHVQDVRQKHEESLAKMGGDCAGGAATLRTECDRTGSQRLPDDDRSRRMGAWPGVDRARLDLRVAGRTFAGPECNGWRCR